MPASPVTLVSLNGSGLLGVLAMTMRGHTAHRQWELANMSSAKAWLYYCQRWKLLAHNWERQLQKTWPARKGRSTHLQQIFCKLVFSSDGTRPITTVSCELQRGVHRAVCAKRTACDGQPGACKRFLTSTHRLWLKGRRAFLTIFPDPVQWAQLVSVQRPWPSACANTRTAGIDRAVGEYNARWWGSSFATLMTRNFNRNVLWWSICVCRNQLFTSACRLWTDMNLISEPGATKSGELLGCSQSKIHHRPVSNAASSVCSGSCYDLKHDTISAKRPFQTLTLDGFFFPRNAIRLEAINDAECN